jgi:branched-chain amino acid transport system permease protein
VAFRPIRDSGVLPALIAAIGLSIALREWARLSGGSGNKWLPPVLADRFLLWEGGGFEVLASGAQLLTLTLAMLAAGVLAWALRRTRLGRAWRACSDDLVAASLLGVDVPRTVAAAFVTGAALAGIAGAVVALQFGEADFSMGYLMGFKALTAALLGGFGSIAGAFVGGLLVGLLEAFWSAAFGLAWKDAAVFAVLIAVLVLRPEGLLGSAQSPRGR